MKSNNEHVPNNSAHVPRRSVPRLAAAVALAAGLIVTAGCTAQSPNGDVDPVRIGLVIHQTGPFADLGRMELIGAKLAVEEINASGGIKSLGGAPIELVVEDAGESAGTAVSAFNRALDKGVVAVEGTGVSSTTLAITEVAERRQVPVLSVAFEDSITERGFQYSFVTSPKLSEVTEMWVNALDDLSAASGNDIERVMIISGVGVAASGPAAAVREQFAPEMGWDIVGDVTVEENSLADATPIVEQVHATNPQYLLIGAGVSDIQKISRKQVERGMKPVPWVLTGAQYLGQAFLDALGEDAVEGSMGIAASAPFKDQSELAERIRAAGDPFPQQYHLVPYSHIHLFAEALEDAGSADSTDIRNALASIDVAAVPASAAWPAQRMRFDDTGRAVDRQAVLVQWQRGKTVTVYPTELAEGAPLFPHDTE